MHLFSKRGWLYLYVYKGVPVVRSCVYVCVCAFACAELGLCVVRVVYVSDCICICTCVPIVRSRVNVRVCTFSCTGLGLCVVRVVRVVYVSDCICMCTCVPIVRSRVYVRECRARAVHGAPINNVCECLYLCMCKCTYCTFACIRSCVQRLACAAQVD